ncbi:MAG: cytochrome P450, partial [Bradyrhizobium sp.]|nr:cytochrome P450 [Bradyrhizobium sp.]
MRLPWRVFEALACLLGATISATEFNLRGPCAVSNEGDGGSWFSSRCAANVLSLFRKALKSGRGPRGGTGLRSSDWLTSCLAVVICFAGRLSVSIAEDCELPLARRPLVPPSPPRAPDNMTAFGRTMAMRKSGISTWGQRAYEEDVLQGRFFGRNSFILNTPDAIRHVLVDNYENYSRTPAAFRVLRPVLGQGVLIAEGRAWKHQRRTLAPAFTPRAVAILVPHMLAVINETVAALNDQCRGPLDLREIMQRMTLEIAGRTMFSFEMGRHGATLRDFVVEYGARLARPHFLDLLLPASWPSPQDFSRARFRKRWTTFVAMLMAERRAAGKSEGAPPRDLFDLMGEAHDPETGAAFSEEQLADEVATMILAGHETTATALFWSL